MADEQEIAFEESGIAEPELDSVVETVARSASLRTRCPIHMGGRDAFLCGREIYSGGPDEQPVCLMHSKTQNKQSGKLFDAFWLEFEKILEEAGENEAHFERFVFPQVNLRGREFRAACNFGFVTFMQDADFSRVIHRNEANFSGAVFMLDATVSGAVFRQSAYFNGTAFNGEAHFAGTFFKMEASFRGASFAGLAHFSAAHCNELANFSGATFTGEARFVDTKFSETSDWRNCVFLDRAEFRRTQFDPRTPGHPSAVFASASFAKPDEINFDDVDLGRVLFHKCDPSQLRFNASVRWGRREGSQRLVIFEEIIPGDQEYVTGLWWNRQRDYSAVAQVYQQLKKNYDARLDYWTANEFHFGEMEMKRLTGPTSGKLPGMRQWLHRNLSLVAFYRWFSDYGNSYLKPMLWLLLIMALTAALLPIPGAGLKREKAKCAETYTSVWRAADHWTPNLWAEARLLGKSAITAVDTATFQKGAEYSPAYPWGRVIAIAETLLTSTLFGLFLLAIRRQFKR
jgi:uncharacterized protein YjbI with pentapeptide repeats